MLAGFKFIYFIQLKFFLRHRDSLEQSPRLMHAALFCFIACCFYNVTPTLQSQVCSLLPGKWSNFALVFLMFVLIQNFSWMPAGGKNCRIKHIHSTYSSCHRWWNKICRQLISVTNCGGLMFGFKVFPNRSGGCAAGPAVRVRYLSQVAWCGFVSPGPITIHTSDLLLHRSRMRSHRHLSGCTLRTRAPPRSACLQKSPLDSRSRCSPPCWSKPKSGAVHPCDSTWGAPVGGREGRRGQPDSPSQAVAVPRTRGSPAECRRSRHHCRQLGGWALCGWH